MKLEDLEIYALSLKLSDQVWNIYTNLNKDIKYHIGMQFLRSIDSVGANIAEGFGRYDYMDSIKFYYNARGSLSESKYWLTLLKNRNLINEENYNELNIVIIKLGIKINNFITVIKKQLVTKNYN